MDTPPCSSVPLVGPRFTSNRRKLPLTLVLRLSSDLPLSQVVHSKLRPTFPPNAPAAYVSLAERCWDHSPALRCVYISDEAIAWIGSVGNTPRVF